MALQPEVIKKLNALYEGLVARFGTTLEDKSVEEFRQMVTKVIKQLASNNKLFTNRLLNAVEFIEGEAYGGSIEEYYTMKAKEWNPSDLTKSTPIPLQEYITYQHKVNFKKVYTTSEPRDIREVLKSPQAFIDFTQSLLVALTNTYNIAKYKNLLEVLKTIHKVATKVQVSVSWKPQSQIVFDNITLSRVRSIVLEMKSPTNKFTLTYKKNGEHSNELEIFSNKVYLIHPANIASDPKALTLSSNNQSVLESALPEIDEFIAIPGLDFALLIDDNTLKCFTTKYKLNTDYNNAEDKTEYFLHVNEIYNFSPFSNAVDLVELK